MCWARVADNWADMFQAESAMVGPAKKWLTNQGLLTKHEFQTPWGVCDLVGVSLAAERVRQRLSLRQRDPIGPALRIDILNRIPDVATGKATTIRSLERTYQEMLTPGELRQEIARLQEWKFIQVSRRGSFQKINGWAPLHKRIVALELKLARVGDGLAQAVSHLGFAEESFVGLPTGLAERVASSNRSEAFRKSGVGLVSVGPLDCFVLLPSKPSRAHVNPTVQMHCVERFWRMVSRGSSS